MKMSTGNILAGFSVSENKFQGVTTLDQIQAFGLLRPSIIDRPGKSLTPDERAAHELHALTNRVFDKARTANAIDYSGYIEATEVHGRPGGTPAITLYYPGRLQVVDGGIIIPYGAKLVAIDGETQTEARYILRDDEGRSPETGSNPFAVTLYHGITAVVAQQILHDYNTKGLPWTETKAVRFNRTGSLSAAVEEAVKSSGLSMDQVNVRGGKANKRTVVALHQMVTLLAAYQLNGAAMQGTIGAAQLKRLNSESSPSVPPTGVQQLSHLIAKAKDDRTLGEASPLVWQAAGLLLSRNVPWTQLNWAGGVEAYAATRTTGRGGPRLPITERLSAIAKAMQS